MKLSIRQTLAIAGCLSIFLTPSAFADERLNVLNDMSITGLSKIITTDQGNGGAVSNYGHNLTVTNGSFDSNALTGNNQAVFGGAIYQNGGTLTINDGVIFNKNIVSSVSQTYPGWDGKDGSSGGALYVIGASNVKIGNVTFSYNVSEPIKDAVESNGGAIFAQSTSNMTIGNASFTRNQSNTRGGAVYNGDTVMTFGKATFEYNSSKNGGAIYALNGYTPEGLETSTTTGSGTAFRYNTASGNGGAIANFDAKVVIGANNEFTGNETNGNGGAIYNAQYDTQTPILEVAGGTTFSGNSAGTSGGAIYNDGTLKLDSTQGNITFQNNSSASGKDVYLNENSTMTVTGTNTVSFQSGEGAIAGTGAINKTGAGTFKLVDSDISQSFTGNYTQNAGTLSLDNSTMSNKFNITGGNLVLRNGSKIFLSENGKIASGTITIGDAMSRAAGDASILTLKKGGQIANVVNLVLYNNNEIVIDPESNMTFGGSGDLWAGKISLKGGILNYEGLETNGQLVAETGNLNINNGTLTVRGTDSANSSSVAEGVNVAIKSGTAMKIGENGTVAINSGDDWKGTVNVTGGQLDYSHTQNGKLTASAGKVNVTGTNSQLTLGNGSSISDTAVVQVIGTGNTLTVGNGGIISGGQTTVATGNEFIIANGGKITGGTNSANDAITNNGTISGGTNTANTFINGGTISGGINTAETLTNNGHITNGTNTASTLTNSGTISGGTNSVTTTLTNNATGQITGGTTTITSDATLSNAGQIKGNAIINIKGSGENSGTISGGTVTIKDGGSLTNTGTISNGKINIESNAELTNENNITGGNIEVNGTLENNGSIGGNSILTINSDGEITVNKDATVDTTGLITIATGGKLTINEGGSAALKENDIWNGEITNTNGTLILNNRTDEGKNYTQSGGELSLNNSKFILDNGGKIEGGTVTVSNGSNFDIGTEGSMTKGNLVFEGTGNTVNVSGEVTSDAQLTINNNNIFNIKEDGDVLLNNNDIWTNGTVQLNGGKLDFQGTVDENGDFANGTLIANSGTLLVNSALDLKNGSTIAELVETTINKDITIQSGSSVELNTGDNWASDAAIIVNGGKLTYDDLTSNGIVKGENGTIELNSGTLTVDTDSYIKDGVNTTIAQDATVNIKNTGYVELNNGDKYEGTINVDGGTLTYNDLTSNSILNATTGSVNIQSGTLTLASGSSIQDAVKTNITGTLDIQNGDVTLSNATDDFWTGTIKLGNDGTLNLNDITNGTLITDGGTLNFNSGELNIKGDSVIGAATDTILQGENIYIAEGGNVTLEDNAKDSWSNNTTVNLQQGGIFDYNLQSNGTLKAEGGSLTTQQDSELTLNSDSYINKEVTANLAGNTTIQNGATVSLGNDGVTEAGGNDSVTGNVTIANGGTLNLFNDVTMKSPIEGEINQQIAINGEMNLETTKELHLNADLSGAGDINKNGEGNIWFHGQNSGYTGNLLVNNGGDLLFENGLAGNLHFGNIDGKTIGIHADEITGDLKQNREATIKYTTYHDDRDLTLNGNIDVSKGNLIAASKGNNNVIFGGTVNVVPADDAQNPVSMSAASNGAITFDENINIENATLNVSSGLGTTFNQKATLNNSILNATNGALTFHNLIFEGTDSILNTMNGSVNNHVIDNLDIYDSGMSNFQIDVSTRDWKSDTFKISNIDDMDGGKINISDWQFIGKAPIDRHIKMQVFDVNSVDPTLMGNIEFTQTDKQIFTPIGWYQMFNQKRYNPITGMNESIPGALTASLVRYNPQVFRGQASTVATYANQLVTNNILFDHIFTVSNQLLAENHPNRYAAAYPQFAPYQYSRKDGSLWYKAYGTLEHINMTQSLKVENNAYGALVGADFPVIEMKNGWSFLPTAYVGYNGAHQNFDGVGMFQNGGQLGAMGTFMKEDFIGSLLLYGGGYGNEMNVAGFTDKTGNWFAGTAAKAAYNFHPTKHFVVQPTLLASYNYFHQQNWWTQFGEMNMNAGRLNGVNVAPGLNLIYGRETWSLYATVQYMFNIMGTSSGNAGNVVLPDVRMKRSYIEYGIGATKTWKDRFSAYIQITLRNVARTGVGFQGGFSIKF